MRFSHYMNEAKEQFKQWQEYVNSNKMLASAVKILKKINSKGYKAYIVGGTVRDITLGFDPHDVDIAGNCPLDEIEKIFPKTTYIGQSSKFGIILIHYEGFEFEYAMLRGESYIEPKYVRKILD